MSIVDNKKAFHDYFIEERYEAGMSLEGWEVKAIRAGRAQLKEAYVIIRNAEIFLFGAHISALPTASTHVNPDPLRTRKLLLKSEEIKRLIGKVERAGFALVPIDLHYSKDDFADQLKLVRLLGRDRAKDMAGDYAERDPARDIIPGDHVPT